ncbi:hypothetical protein L291_3085 [Acinetobacter guillouiae MSP4-18]|nr:hypothetical protein L291_3085 [Acinetobacter guillouiae MSP4-18]
MITPLTVMVPSTAKTLVHTKVKSKVLNVGKVSLFIESAL